MRRRRNPLYRSVDDQERVAPRVVRLPSPPGWLGPLAVVAILVYELIAGQYVQLAVIAALGAVALLMRVRST
jgi:hypothetical protein